MKIMLKCDICGEEKVTSIGQYTLCHSHSKQVDRYKEYTEKAWSAFGELKDLFKLKGFPL